MTLPFHCLKVWTPCVGIAAGLAGPLAAHAEQPISTDRPDFVESSDVVGPGRVQIETGLAFERTRTDGLSVRTRTTPALLRIGVNDSLELRLETDGLTRSDTDDGAGTTRRVNGASDLSLGLKWQQQEGDAAHDRPAIAWLAHVDVASGSREFRGQGLRPSLRMVAEWELPQDLSVGIMPGLIADKNADGHRFVAGLLAVTLAKGWGPAWHGFIELAGQQLASHKNGGSLASLDCGFAYLLADSVQVDFSVARGLTSSAPDWQWGAGLSMRF